MTVPTTMRAVEISEPGGPEVLRLTERAVPVPGPGQVLLKVAFAGVNRPDVLQRAGLYAPPSNASDLPGLEASGAVVSVGPGVGGAMVGQQVCALLPGGGYAEYAVTPASHCLPVPSPLGLKEAACLPETHFTVWSNIVMRGGLKGGETILIHGGSSGIGTTAIQIAKALGARVFCTVGNEAKAQMCQSLGAERAILYKSEDFVEVLRSAGGADLILDMVGGDYIPKNIRVLKTGGRLVQIAFLQSPKVELNFAQVMMRRLTITGSTLRPQSDLAKTRIAEQLRAQVWPMLETGQIAPVMDSEFAIVEASKAHAWMETSEHIGKIVLRV